MCIKPQGLIIILVFLGLAVGLEAKPPLITSKNGILYQDGKPCFLAGVWSGPGYSGALEVRSHCRGRVDFDVPGRQGTGAQVTFQSSAGPISRWVEFPGFDPAVCAAGKYRFFKIWVKGDGSDNVLKLIAERYEGKTMATVTLGEITLTDTNWKQFVFPLEDKYDVLSQANDSYFYRGATDKGFSFTVDDITLSGPDGEDVLFDFDRKKASPFHWNRLGQRDRFKDDPVYQAIWNDPLYQEISADNFAGIGMNTMHLQQVQNDHPAELAFLGSGNPIGEAVLCEKLAGMPMIPGWTFNPGTTYYSDQAEGWVKNNDLPPTVLQRTPDGRPVGSYMAVNFEDPTGSKIFRYEWQEGARRLLKDNANIYAYELINENSGFYKSGSAYNQAEFIRRLKARYGDIAALNKDWGTDYPTFEAVQVRVPELGDGANKIKGLSIEWNKFLEDRYVEMLHQGGEWIHQVEDELGRPHALMGQMGYPTWDLIGYGGSYMYKMAKGLDCIQTEAGITLGSGSYSGEVNPLTDVWASKGTYGHQMMLDLADAACPDKPIINTEHSMYRRRGNLTEPVTKSDVITSLWEEFIRGASAVHTYCWNVRYSSREEALAAGYFRDLLSPHLYPRESLNGYKEVNEEIKRVADVVMERPRLGRDAGTAVLFSRPTARYLVGVPSWVSNWKDQHPFYRSHETMYKYLLENHYPFCYLYEEQLPESVSRYRLILAPHSDNIYPETFRLLEDFVKKGGTLVCFGDGFRYDEYGNEKDRERSGLLGLLRKKAKFFVGMAELKGVGSIKVKNNRQVTLTTARCLASFSDSAEPFVTVNQVGQGKVYYINADMFRNEIDLTPVLNFAVRLVNLQAPVEVVDQDGLKIPGIEAYQIPKGDKRVLFLVNQVPYRDVVAKVRLKGIPDQDKYRLVDVVRNSICLKGGQATITGRQLREGINFFLPDQERVVLLLTRDDYQTPNPAQELLSDAAAREMDRKVKKEIETAAARQALEARVSRETILGVRDFGTKNVFESLKQSSLATAGASLLEVRLLDADNSQKVKNYGLREGADSVLKCRFIYQDALTKEAIDKIQTDILDALGQKFSVKVIKSGLDESGFWYLQQYRDIAEAGCIPLDIRRVANMGFADGKADDQKGGLFDEGRSLVGFPVGRQKFSNIPFDIIDPARNNGVSCIILKGQAKPYFPERAEGIPVGRRVRNIYVSNASAWTGVTEGVVYRVRLNYSDGASGSLEVKVGDEIKDWFNAAGADINLVNAKLGWQGKARELRKTPTGEDEAVEYSVGLYCSRLVNPQPGKEVRTLDLISANAKAVPGVFGITVEE